MSKELSTKTIENTVKLMTNVYKRFLKVDEPELISYCRQASNAIDKKINDINRKSHRKMFSGMSQFLGGFADTVEEDYFENVKRINR